MAVGDPADHADRHGLRVGTQLGVHARDHHVEAVEHLRRLVEVSVLEDVHLDGGQQTHTGVGRRSDVGDHRQLFGQPLGSQPAGHREAR